MRNSNYILVVNGKASNLARRNAFIIDLFILASLFTLVFRSIYTYFDSRSGYLKCFMLVLIVAYLALCFKDAIRGRSIGKRIIGLAVRTSSSPNKIPSLPNLLLRNVLTFLWIIECISVYACKDKKKIGDRLASTEVYYVIRKNNANNEGELPISSELNMPVRDAYTDDIWDLIDDEKQDS